MADRIRAVPRFDLVLAVAACCWALTDPLLRSFDRPLLALVAAPVMTLPLAFRRVDPAPVLVLVLSGLGLRELAGPTGEDPPLLPLVILTAIYSTGAWAERRGASVGLGIALGFGLVALREDPTASATKAQDVFYYGCLVCLPWVAGRIVRGVRSRSARSVSRAVEAERARATAVEEERRRIAQELHDVVSHAVSVIVLQARGGRRVLAGDPERARVALTTIERSGAQALDEMRRLVMMLRTADEELALAPQPALRHLDDLAASVRAAGLPVEIMVRGEPVDLPPSVDLSAFRIVQEALTNALKHAGPASARVVVTYREDAVELAITDTGTGQADSNPGGHGLVGIGERVALFGGQLESGTQPRGGYALRALLPLESQP